MPSSEKFSRAAVPEKTKKITHNNEQMLKDTTDIRAAKAALEESERRFNDLAVSNGEWIWEADLNGRYTYSSPSVERVLGYSVGEVIEKSFHRFLHPTVREQLKKKGLRLFRNNRPFRNFVSKNLRKDGRTIILETTGTPMFNSSGEVRGFRGSHRDITEKKRLEERLAMLNFFGGKLNAARNLQQVYDLIMNASQRTLSFDSGSFLVYEKGILRTVSQRGIPQPLPNLLLRENKGITVNAARRRRPILVGDVKKEENYVEGIRGIRSELAVPVASGSRVLGVLDLESKELDAFDEQDATLLEILASHSATAISNLEKRSEIEKRSNQLSLLMKNSAEMMHNMAMQKRLQKIAKAIKELGWRRVVIRAVRNETLDLESRADLVTAGLTREEREFLWKHRMRGRIWTKRFGPEFEQFKLGEFYHLPWSDPWVRKKFSRNTVPSKLPLEEMVDWDPQDLLYAPLRLADGRIVGVLSVDDPLDGRRPTRESLAPLELFLRQAAVAIENAQLFEELDGAKNEIRQYANQLELKVKQRTAELMEAQNKLLKTERLAAIGEVAAMVGHDLRNPLTGIAGATYYLKTKLKTKEDKAIEMLELIERSIEYSNKIISDLLDYSRDFFLETTATTPKAIVRGAFSMISIPRNIKTIYKIEDESRITVDVGKMKRVILNILKNSVEAMPKGGKLTLSSVRKNHCVEISISDTGVGMSKGALEKIGLPLYTTKAKGMGLGLPICKRIVEAHGGNISASSEEGKGTTFTLTVPLKPKTKKIEKVCTIMPESLTQSTTGAYEDQHHMKTPL